MGQYIKTQTIYSTSTATTTERVEEILTQISDLFFGDTGILSGANKAISKTEGTERVNSIKINASSGNTTAWSEIKINNAGEITTPFIRDGSTIGSSSTTLRLLAVGSPASTVGTAEIHLSYAQGLDGDVIVTLKPASEAHSLAYPTLLYLTAVNPATKAEKRVLLHGYHGGGSANNYFYVIPSTKNVTIVSNSLAMTKPVNNAGFDIMLPIMIEGEEYIFKNVYQFTNNADAESGVVTDGTHKYAIFKIYGDRCLALKIE